MVLVVLVVLVVLGSMYTTLGKGYVQHNKHYRVFIILGLIPTQDSQNTRTASPTAPHTRHRTTPGERTEPLSTAGTLCLGEEGRRVDCPGLTMDSLGDRVGLVKIVINTVCRNKA